MSSILGNGIIKVLSSHSFEETVQRLEGLLAGKGIKLFATVDHNAEADRVGLTMPPTKLLIFGNPRAGTPIMVAKPSAAIDLPLKLLVAADGESKVWISYDSPDYLQGRHGFPPEFLQNVSAAALLAEAVNGRG